MPPIEDSENPDQLPRSELNPMLNPILGQNLGRWAEVYFTSPPEDRDRAVEDLLKELEAQRAEAEAGSEIQAEQESSVSEASVLESLLPMEREPDPLPSADSIRQQICSAGKDPNTGHAFYSRLAAEPRRNYVLLGAVFAIAAILILIYTVWGSRSPGSPESWEQQAQAPSRVQPSDPTGNSPDRGDQPSQPQLQVRDTARAEPGRPFPPDPKTQPAPMASANGAEELTLAKRFLNGSNGKTRDSSEAAKWLWKAVAKQNLEAADLLATLYLTGEGVPKSCDQARVLLEAAARKGIPGAAQRLANLGSFGCE